MERTPLARSSELPEGGSLRFRAVVRGEEVAAFAVRYGGVVRGYVNRCTHRMVELDLGKGEFFHPDGERLLCRAHGAIFDPASGACAGGACPKTSALEEVPLEERDGTIWILAGGRAPA